MRYLLPASPSNKISLPALMPNEHAIPSPTLFLLTSKQEKTPYLYTRHSIYLYVGSIYVIVPTVKNNSSSIDILIHMLKAVTFVLQFKKTVP